LREKREPLKGASRFPYKVETPLASPSRFCFRLEESPAGPMTALLDLPHRDSDAARASSDRAHVVPMHRLRALAGAPAKLAIACPARPSCKGCG